MQVSLYGHSLGSVLSYDILCHQENLSSPFHVDLASKENLYRESSNASVGRQPSECGSTSNLGKDILIKNENKGMEDPTDKAMLNFNSELSPVETLANFSPATLPVSSADELSPESMGSKQPNDDSPSTDEHSPSPVVSKQPNDDSPSADVRSPVHVGFIQPNENSESDEIQTNIVPATLQVSSADEHSLVHVESIQPNVDSPLNEDHAYSVPAIHPVSTSNESSPVHVGSRRTDGLPSDENITPPVLDHSNLLSGESDESNKPESTYSDLTKEKGRISGNLVGCSNESSAEVSESCEVKSIDALMEEVTIFTLLCDFVYLLLV